MPSPGPRRCRTGSSAGSPDRAADGSLDIRRRCVSRPSSTMRSLRAPRTCRTIREACFFVVSQTRSAARLRSRRPTQVAANTTNSIRTATSISASASQTGAPPPITAPAGRFSLRLSFAGSGVRHLAQPRHQFRRCDAAKTGRQAGSRPARSGSGTHDHPASDGIAVLPSRPLSDPGPHGPPGQRGQTPSHEGFGHFPSVSIGIIAISSLWDQPQAARPPCGPPPRRRSPPVPRDPGCRPPR